MGYADAQYIVNEVLRDAPNKAASGLPVCDFTFNAYYGYKSINVKFSARDTVIDGELISRFEDVTIVYKKDSIPEHRMDGELIGVYGRDDMTTYADTPITVSDLDYGTYYVRAFTRSDHAVISSCAEWIRKIELKFAPIYGFHQNFKDHNPDTCITYIETNKDYDPLHCNVSTGNVVMGGWDIGWDWLNRVKPFMVKTNGEVDYALDPDDYTKKLEDGTPSDIANADYDGGAYVWIPKIYCKEIYSDDGTERTVYFCENDQDPIMQGAWKWPFVMADGTEIEGFWLAMFFPDLTTKKPLGLNPNKYISGLFAGVVQGGSFLLQGFAGYQQITQYKNTLTDSPNTRASFFGGSATFLFRDILYMLAKSTDIQKHMGCGAPNIGASDVLGGYTPSYITVDISHLYTHGGFYGYGVPKEYKAGDTSTYQSLANGYNYGKLFHCMTLGAFADSGLYRYGNTLKIVGTNYYGYPNVITMIPKLFDSLSTNMVDLEILNTSIQYPNIQFNSMKYSEYGSTPYATKTNELTAPASLDECLCDYHRPLDLFDYSSHSTNGQYVRKYCENINIMCCSYGSFGGRRVSIPYNNSYGNSGNWASPKDAGPFITCLMPFDIEYGFTAGSSPTGAKKSADMSAAYCIAPEPNWTPYD